MAEYQIVELKLCENCARTFVRHDASLLCGFCQSMSPDELQRAAVAAGYGLVRIGHSAAAQFSQALKKMIKFNGIRGGVDSSAYSIALSGRPQFRDFLPATLLPSVCYATKLADNRKKLQIKNPQKSRQRSVPPLT